MRVTVDVEVVRLGDGVVASKARQELEAARTDELVASRTARYR